jgi:hypothetical protein
MSEPARECLERGVDAVVRHHVQVNNVGLFIGPLGAVVAGDCSVIIETDPFGLLIEPVAHWDVEVGDLAVIDSVASRGLIESSLIVKDTLLEVVEMVFIPFSCDAGTGFVVGNGLEEAIGDASK